MIYNLSFVINVSIHAPHEGERLTYTPQTLTEEQFQSTLPTRGSDDYRGGLDRPLIMFQSTLPTRGSDRCCPGAARTVDVSIHAPHEGERRRTGATSAAGISLFQSTLPTRGSDVWLVGNSARDGVSIHAPHEGERRLQSFHGNCRCEFQSTLPTRGSDQSTLPVYPVHICFNPRSPRGGATDSGR